MKAWGCGGESRHGSGGILVGGSPGSRSASRPHTLKMLQYDFARALAVERQNMHAGPLTRVLFRWAKAGSVVVALLH